MFIIERSTGICVAKVGSLKEASSLTGVGITNVSQQVAGKIKSPWGEYLFTSKKTKVYPGKISKVNRRRRIKIYTSDMKLVEIVDNATEAAWRTGTQTAHIRKYCVGKLKFSTTGFTFRYAD